MVGDARRRSEEVESPSVNAFLQQRRLRGVVSMFGPAFVAAIAYVDPGNFSTNLGAGAAFGTSLVWVVVLASAMAMPVQYLSAKVGIVTGQTLPEICRHRYRPVVRWLLWAQAELVAMATDLAEFVGAALGLRLLFGVPLFPAALLTAVTAFALLGLQQRGYRGFERAIAALLLIIIGGFAYQVLHVGPEPGPVVAGLIPQLPGSSTYLAVGIIGATVMPHVVYLHSALTSHRIACSTDHERRTVLRFERWDVALALSVAGLVNLSMLLIAAQLFHTRGRTDIDDLIAAHHGLATFAGGSTALAFAVALLASGLSSSSVGTYAGQIVLTGFLNLHIPLALRRGLTMLPALLTVGLGANATDVLNLSQVLLSFGIPFALIPLLLITRDRHIMGSFTNKTWLTTLTTMITVVIVSLNLHLISTEVAP